MEKKDPIEEARRYVANAEEVIKKANYDPELNIYTDGKYVKMAGNLRHHAFVHGLRWHKEQKDL